MTGEAALELVREPQDSTDDLPSVVRRRLDGSYAIDPWGLDADVLALGTHLAALRWNVTVSGLEHLPREGAAMLICNRRLGWSEPAVIVTALAREAGRHVRPLGGPDVDPLGGLLWRFGALPARPDDVAGALRAGSVVAVPTRRELVRFRPGYLPVHLLEPAVELGAAVLPVAVTGWEAGRRWTIQIGAPVHRPSVGGPRSVGRVAVDVAGALAELLDAAASRSIWQRTRRRLLDSGAGLATRIAPSAEIEI
jgi:hypothetical protein